MLYNLKDEIYAIWRISHQNPMDIRNRSSFSHELPASLKDDTVRMNDRNIYKKTGQMNYQTADPKAKASVFLFFPIAHFLKTILTNRKNRTFGFVRNTRQPFAKPKEPFFANAQLKNINSKIINWQYR